MAGGGIVDTAMPQAGLQDPMTAAAAAGGPSGRGNAMDTNPNMPLPLNGTHPHAGPFSQHQLMQASSSQVQGGSSAAGQQQQQQPVPMMRSMDSFTGSVGAPDMAAQAAAMQQQQQEPAQALPFPEGVKVVPLPVPPAAATAVAAAGVGSSGVPPPGALNPAAPGVLGSVSQQGNMGPGSSNVVGAPFQGSVPSLQALAVREASVELSTGGAAVAAAAAAGGGLPMPVAVPSRSHVSADGGAGSLMQLAGSAGAPSSLGTSPALGGPSPALLLEDHAAGASGGLQAVIATSQAMVAAGGPAATAVSRSPSAVWWCVLDDYVCLIKAFTADEHVQYGPTTLALVFFGAELLRVCVGSTSLQRTPTGFRRLQYGIGLAADGIMCRSS